MSDLPIMSDKELGELARAVAEQGSLALHEHHPDLEHLRVGLVWDVTGMDHALDLDLAALLLGADGKVRSAADFIFYNQPKSACGQVQHLGDAKAKNHPANKLDKEMLLINLARIPDDVEKIAILVSIHKGNERKQNFGLVRSARVSLYNEGKNGALIARLDLTEEVALATGCVVGELQRRGENKLLHDWAYVAVGQGDENGLGALLPDYGVAG